MIACISAADTNFEETLSTLKYAHTTKSVNNRPTMNVENDPKDQLIRELQNEIKNLRHRLDYRSLDTAWWEEYENNPLNCDNCYVWWIEEIYDIRWLWLILCWWDKESDDECWKGGGRHNLQTHKKWVEAHPRWEKAEGWGMWNELFSASQSAIMGELKIALNVPNTPQKSIFI